MKIILDVHYGSNQASVAGVQFRHWSDSRPHRIETAIISGTTEYVPGQFYKRELPCLLKLLRGIAARFEAIVIDGYVHLRPPLEKGLGAHLADALAYPVVILGVAKNPLKSAHRFLPIHRGRSRKPLFISSLGIPTALRGKAIFLKILIWGYKA